MRRVKLKMSKPALHGHTSRSSISAHKDGHARCEGAEIGDLVCVGSFLRLTHMPSLQNQNENYPIYLLHTWASRFPGELELDHPFQQS